MNLRGIKICEHTFREKLREEIKFRHKKPFKVICIFKCKNCGAEIKKESKPIKEKFKQIDLHGEKSYI
jgi:uncharacterized protein with PIN domain